MVAFEAVVKQLGFLTDRQILAGLEDGHLLEKGSWDRSSLRHASYTLRLGNEVRICRAGGSAPTATKEFAVVHLTQATPKIKIHPGDTALLYSMETLRFPDSVLGFTVARGLFFAEGLCPENTYVDPGFTGPIYTTITNVSSRVVELEYGMPVTRLFFFRLTEPVQNGYRSGSALGIAQQLKSVRATAISPDECRTATDTQLLESVKLIPIAGQQAAESFSRMTQRQMHAERRLIALAVSWPALLVFANSNAWVLGTLGTFLGNVSASIVATVLMLSAPKLTAWFRIGGGK